MNIVEKIDDESQKTIKVNKIQKQWHVYKADMKNSHKK